jgi:hypothetical protein
MASDVAIRATVLGALDFRARFEGAHASGAADPTVREMAQGVTDWVRDAGLVHHATPAERTLFELAVLAWPKETVGRVASDTPLEAAGALLWALGVAKLPTYDQSFDPDTLRVLPFLSDSPFVTEPGMAPAAELESMTRLVRLRPSAAIDAEERRAGAWLWRSRTTYLIHTGQITVARARAIIREGLPSCAELGIPVTTDPDFRARGKAYAALAREEYVVVARIAHARTQALRWVQGDLSWQHVPMDS